MVVITGQVADQPDRHRRVPGSDTVGITRHCTKHNYLVKDPAELGAIDPRGVPHRHLRPPGPGRGRHPQGRAGRDRALCRRREPQRRTRAIARRSRPTRRDRRRRSRCSPRPSARSSTPAAASSTPGPRASAAAARARAAHRRAGHLDADGPRRLPGHRPDMARHARHARHLRSQYGDEPVRPDASCVGARFDDRVTGRLDAFSPGLEEDPHRYRPLVDQQDRPRSTSPSSATVGRVLERLIAAWKARSRKARDLGDW